MKAKPVKVFVINRALWGVGLNAVGALYAITEKGSELYCCLGVYCRRAGARPKQLLGRGMPREIARQLPGLPAWLLKGHYNDLVRLVELNDQIGLAQDQREKQIAAIFTKHGVTVRYIGELPAGSMVAS